MAETRTVSRFYLRAFTTITKADGAPKFALTEAQNAAASNSSIGFFIGKIIDKSDLVSEMIRARKMAIVCGATYDPLIDSLTAGEDADSSAKLFTSRHDRLKDAQIAIHTKVLNMARDGDFNSLTLAEAKKVIQSFVSGESAAQLAIIDNTYPAHLAEKYLKV